MRTYNILFANGLIRTMVCTGDHDPMDEIGKWYPEKGFLKEDVISIDEKMEDSFE